MSVNPYSPPQSSLIPSAPDTVDPAVESIRRDHLNAEGNIKGIGVLYVLSSLVVALSAVAPLLNRRETQTITAEGLALAAFILALAVGQAVVGVGIRQLQGWSRIPGIVLSLPGLLAFPVGTLVGLIVMVSLLTKRARMVFSPEYKEVIAATPHIKYKSRLLRIFFLLVAAIIGLVVVGAIFIQLSR